MNIQEIIKRIIVGIAKIIPGLSGAVILISFNLYDRAIQALTNFFDNPKKNFFFLLNLSMGIIIGIVLFSKIISYFLTKYYLYTTMFFLGLIIGGIPTILKETSKKKRFIFLSIISFILMLIPSLTTTTNNYIIKNNFIDIIIFFTAGLLEAAGTVLPGISSTALLMLIGVYDNYIITLSNILNITQLIENLYFLIPFSIGMLLGIIAITILVNYLFKLYRKETFSIILGISLATIISLIIRLAPYIIDSYQLILSSILLMLGYLLTKKLT